MAKALYYPFTSPCNSTSFLKSALFLWDSVDFIVPEKDFSRSGLNREQRRAMEIIAGNHVPTQQEKQKVHDRVAEICKSEMIDRFYFDLEDPEMVVDFYADKFMDQTWDLLGSSNFAKVSRRDGVVGDASIAKLVAYRIMAEFASVCAGDDCRVVTDHADPYRSFKDSLIDIDSLVEDGGDWHARLISINLATLNFGGVSLKRLNDIREKDGDLLSQLRGIYAAKVDQYVGLIRGAMGDQKVVDGLIREFREYMEKDMRELKVALGWNAGRRLMSKGVWIALLSLMGVDMSDFERFVGVGGLLGNLAGVIKDEKRDKILGAHPAAWLLEVK